MLGYVSINKCFIESFLFVIGDCRTNNHGQSQTFDARELCRTHTLYGLSQLQDIVTEFVVVSYWTWY